MMIQMFILFAREPLNVKTMGLKTWGRGGGEIWPIGKKLKSSVIHTKDSCEKSVPKRQNKNEKLPYLDNRFQQEVG
jgi:hypothetical protein